MLKSDFIKRMQILRGRILMQTELIKLTPHFTLFDPANMIPTLGNRGLPNSAML